MLIKFLIDCEKNGKNINTKIDPNGHKNPKKTVFYEAR